ncbi:MAG: phosphatase PAP2 family protein [Gemmatimonadota bacterium]
MSSSPGAKHAGSVLAVDRLMAAYNLILAVLWVPLLTRAWYAPGILAAHAAAGLLPALLGRGPASLSRPLRLLRESYPLLWLPVLWIELDMLISLLHDRSGDSAILSLDLALFGVHIDRVWMPAMPQLWFSELMHFAYYAYYALIFLPPIAVALAGRVDAFRDMTVRLMATYLCCYLFYLAFPVVGPHGLGQPFEGPLTNGFFYRLVEAAHATGDVRGAAFPSSHVAGAVTIALLGWRWFPSGIALLMSVEAVGVMMATVYTQNHYGIDSVAGLVWALAIQALLVPALLGWPPVRAVLPGAPRLPAPPGVLPEPQTGGGLA